MCIEDDDGDVSDGDSCIYGAADTDRDQRLTPMLLLKSGWVS